jgi:hypothetical protein
VCDKKKRLTRKKKEQEKEKKSCAFYSPFINSGMFHSEEERNRTVDPLNELQHSYGSTTATNSPGTFELGQFTSCDLDTIGFDFDCDFERSDACGPNSSTCIAVGEPQCFTTFTSEDKWPI